MTTRRVQAGVELPPFQRLLDSHAVDVHRFLVACVGPVDADDCYQDTWVSALRAYPELSSAANLRGWLFTIAHHKALDLLRARRRQPVAMGEELPDAPGPEMLEATLGADTQLWRAVAELPPKQRTAVALRFIVDADYARIATMMETSEDAARRSVHEALKRLRREDLDAD